MRRTHIAPSHALLRVSIIALAAIALDSACLAAQATTAPTAPRPEIVRVHVTDTTGAPVAGASVAIVRGLQQVVAQGVTDANGQRVLTVAGAAGDYDAMVRKIGFTRADRFFGFQAGDTVTLHLLLAPAVQTLAQMNVTAPEDRKRLRRYVDADDIANSPRPILDAMDVVTKLRPDMMSDPTPGSMDHCALDEVWVNGQHITLAPINDALAARAAMKVHGTRFASPVAPGGNPGLTGPPMTPFGDARVPVSVQSVLATIHPEHIAEMTFHDCNDFSINRAHARNALFVVLKPGVAFEPGIGSYVLDEGSGSKRFTVAARELARSDSLEAASTATQTLEAFRHRLLGLFDAGNGQPIAGVEVVDSTSGSWVRTPDTGIVSLAFLPPGPATVLLRRAGTADTLIHVTISPRDTTPITLVLGGAPR
ncbi:MAG TPA: carboxypeptidase-like regulatory domain-containing protein [Gemmatimonadaceae bacterium]|nr:carboxypeptidase-like regulatory domain-containing protein [Gemmatimonadaceae bacterium]